MDQGQADTIGLPDLYLRPPTDHDHSDTIRLPDLYLGSSTDQDQADTLGLPDLYLGSSMGQEQADTIGLPDLYLGSSDVQEQSEDQYRPMTPGEEEIMKIYTEGIYCSPDMIEKSGGFWITSSSVKPEESCSRQAALQPPIAAASDSDLELEKLLRDTPELSTPPVQSPPPSSSRTTVSSRSS